MEYTDLISNRESIRNYDPDRPLSKEVLEKILDAGRLAPSACNIQPWKFLVISSPGMLEKVRPCYHREWFREAPYILVVAGFKEQAWKRSSDGYNSIETDLAIAMTHLILAAENEGIGTCWIANFNTGMLSEALNLTEDQIVFCITPLGYQRAGFKKSGNKKRKSLEELVEFM